MTIEIRLAKNSGFCFGVKRAIALAEETASKYGKATTIGPIIHNPQMVKKLSVAGVNAIEDLDLIKNEPVIIRSHGIPVETFDQLKEKGVVIVDATFPYVAKAHDYAKKADKDGYEIIILGNPEHPEIVALTSYISGKWHVAKDEGREASECSPPAPSQEGNLSTAHCSLPTNHTTIHSPQSIKKIAIICQTTQNIDNLRRLTEQILPLTNELRIFNTICNATNVRQQSSLELAKECDLMIVIGGKNSSNTLMLTKLCSEFTTTKHIEEADEIEKEWFDCLGTRDEAQGTRHKEQGTRNKVYGETLTSLKPKTSNLKPILATHHLPLATNLPTVHSPQSTKIGLTAGASTPDWIIIDVYNKIIDIVGDDDRFVQSVEEIPGFQEEPNE